MPLPSRPLVVVGALVLGAVGSGCSHEHGPLSDTPDTTSLGNAGRLGVAFISTSEGLALRPRDPSAVVEGTVQGTTSPLTTEVRPPRTLFGTSEDWSLGQSVEPETGWTMRVWTSGPVLPVEPWNMAIASPAGEGGGEGHGGAKGHQPR